MLFDLSIYNIQGKIIENIISNNLGTGSQSISYNAKELSSGIYFIQLKTSSFTDYSKIVFNIKSKPFLVSSFAFSLI